MKQRSLGQPAQGGYAGLENTKHPAWQANCLRFSDGSVAQRFAVLDQIGFLRAGRPRCEVLVIMIDHSADPLEYRLRYFESVRERAVLQAAAERAGWERRPSPRGDQVSSCSSS